MNVHPDAPPSLNFRFLQPPPPRRPQKLPKQPPKPTEVAEAPKETRLFTIPEFWTGFIQLEPVERQ